jgi:hypothetical protein
MPREVGARHLAAAPLPRPGFVPDPALLEVLVRLLGEPPE